MEEVLSEAKDQASIVKEEVLVAKALASKVAMAMVMAFRSRRKYHLEVLEASRDAF